MATSFKVSAKEVKLILSKTFPTRKREVRIRIAESVSLSATYWDSGSKTDYLVYEKGKGGYRIKTDGNPFQKHEHPVFELAPGTVLVEESIFQGKAMSPTIHIHPSDPLAVELKAKKISPIF